jgi:hypothetical protein
VAASVISLVVADFVCDLQERKHEPANRNSKAKDFIAIKERKVLIIVAVTGYCLI